MQRSLVRIARRPRLPLLAAVTLALAIASTTLISTFVNTLVLEPLPIGDPERVVVVYATSRELGVSRGGWAADTWEAWTGSGGAFEFPAATDARHVAMQTEAGPIRVRGQRVTDEFFRAWGLQTALGREPSAAGGSGTAHEALGGLMALVRYRVATSTAELAIRRTLGATSAAIVGLVARDALSLVAIGLAPGFAAPVPVTNALAGWAPTQVPLGALAYWLVGLVIIFAASAAAMAPIRAAVALDPSEALRS